MRNYHLRSRAASGEDSEFYLKNGFYVVAVNANPVITAKTPEQLKAHLDAAKPLRQIVPKKFYISSEVR